MSEMYSIDLLYFGDYFQRIKGVEFTNGSLDDDDTSRPNLKSKTSGMELTLEFRCRRYSLELTPHSPSTHFSFSGGAESLFGNKKKHDVIVEVAGQKCLYSGNDFNHSTSPNSLSIPGTIKDLLQWMKTNILTGREDLFLQNDTIRPGILILVNEADWELVVSSIRRRLLKKN